MVNCIVALFDHTEAKYRGARTLPAARVSIEFTPGVEGESLKWSLAVGGRQWEGVTMIVGTVDLETAIKVANDWMHTRTPPPIEAGVVFLLR